MQFFQAIHRKRWMAVLLLAPLFGGCAHQIELLAREGSERGSGTFGQGSRTVSMSIRIGGIIYSGKAVMVQGSNYGMLRDVGRPGSAPGPKVGGRGTAFLYDPSGGSLRCELDYSGQSGTGVGVCFNDAGKAYDMRIL